MYLLKGDYTVRIETYDLALNPFLIQGLYGTPFQLKLFPKISKISVF